MSAAVPLAAPCGACPLRATCRVACGELLALLPPGEVRAWNEVSSLALMAGRGYDPQFRAMHPALVEPAMPRGAAWRALVRAHRPALRAALARLTPSERAVVQAVARGASYAELGRARGVTRQAVAKTYHRGLRRLRTALGLVTVGAPARPRPRQRRPGWAPLVNAAGRAILLRARGAGLSVAELSARTGLSPATIRRCVRRARTETP